MQEIDMCKIRTQHVYVTSIYMFQLYKQNIHIKNSGFSFKILNFYMHVVQ